MCHPIKVSFFNLQKCPSSCLLRLEVCLAWRSLLMMRSCFSLLHSSEIRGLRSTKCSSETLQNFLYFMYNMKSLKWNSWNFYFNEKKSDSIEIFQMFQIMNSGGWQKVFQYKGKKVTSNLVKGFLSSFNVVHIYFIWQCDNCRKK